MDFVLDQLHLLWPLQSIAIITKEPIKKALNFQSWHFHEDIKKNSSDTTSVLPDIVALPSTEASLFMGNIEEMTLD
jgi:hypothetical protein